MPDPEAGTPLGRETWNILQVRQPDRDIDLGLERSAKEMGITSLDDVKIIQGSHHPLVQVYTRLLKDEVPMSTTRQ